MALDSGLVDVKESLSCDKSEEVGEKIQKEMTGMPFGEVSLKQKNQVTTLQSLHSTIKVGKDKVTIDPLTLFLRLIVIVQKKPDEEITDYFRYELSPFPLSLFKDGIMRAPNKSKLKSFLIQNTEKAEPSPYKSIADGGALLWCCNWRRNESFDDILKRYVTFLKSLKIDIIVLDGYSASTKDCTHNKREIKSSNTVEITEKILCPTDRTSFLSNYKNKRSFVNWLANKLKDNGFTINVQQMLTPQLLGLQWNKIKR